jgi:transposase InsO family protein
MYRLKAPEFSGKDSENVVAWLEQMKEGFVAENVTNELRMVAYSVNALRGAALAWWQEQKLRRAFENFNDFETRLKESFRPPNLQHVLRQQLADLKQTGSYMDYVTKFRTLVGQVEQMAELDQVHYFINGLKQQTKKEVKYQSPDSINRAVEIGFKFESSNFGAGRTAFKPRHMHSSARSDPMEVDSIDRKHIKPKHRPQKYGNAAKKQQNQTGCFGCGGNHFVRDCPHRQNAKYQANHMEEPQPSLNSIIDEALGLSINSASQYSHSLHAFKTSSTHPALITLEGHIGINNTPVKFLIDSGASDNFMTLNVATQAKLLIDAAEASVASLGNGSNAKIVGRAKAVTTRVGTTHDLNDFLILEGHKNVILLGMPWLQKTQPFINWSSKSVDLTPARFGKEHNMQGQQDKKPASEESAEKDFHPSNKYGQQANSTNSHLLNNDGDTHLRVEVVDSSSELSGLLSDPSNSVFLASLNKTTAELQPSRTTELSAVNQEKLRGILEKHQEVFGSNITKLPPDGFYKHYISLESNKPVYRPPYRLSPREKQAAEDFVKEMLESGLIRESSSPYSSPLLFVKKKDGSLRAVIDYRMINKVTVKDRYPVPRILDLLEKLRTATIFSKMDWLSGFYQVRMDEKAVPFTAFSAAGKQWEFLVMPMGMCNSPSTFQRFTRSIFGPEFDQFLLIYFDDFLVFSETQEQHLHHLDKVLSKLKQCGFLLKASKCSFGLKEIIFVGHKISAGKRSIDPEKIRSVQDFPTPHNASEIRQFHGLLRWVSDHLPNLASEIEPLLRLIRKNTHFRWTNIEQASFEKLKSTVARNIELTLPDLNLDYILQTDASDFGVGAVLKQKQGEAEVIIAFASRSLNTAERNYAVHDKEMLAIFWAVKHYRAYLEGRKTTVQTDHSSLQYMLTQPNLSRRQTRWMEFLGQFDIDIEYIRGATNSLADLMSRNPDLKAITVMGPEGPDPCVREAEEFLEEDWPLLVLKAITEGVETVPDKMKNFIENEMSNFELNPESHILYRLTAEGKRAFIPFTMRANLVEKVHIGSGHSGVNEVIRRIGEKAWWPYFKRDIKLWLQTCEQCQVFGNRSNIPRVQQFGNQEFDKPFFRWNLDFIGPIKESESGNKWIITAIDSCTRWPIAKAVKNATVKEVAEFLYYEIVVHFGCPAEILTDRGSNFMASVTERYLELLRVKHKCTSAYHPRTNGKVENFNGLLTRIIAKCCGAAIHKWDMFLPEALFHCRTRIHQITGFSPFKLLYGVEARIPGDSSPPFCLSEQNPKDLAEIRARVLEDLKLWREAAYERTRQDATQRKLYYDKLVREDPLKKDEWVLLSRPAKIKEKFKPNWIGPYRIVEARSSGVYKLSDPKGNIKQDLVHRDRLKRCRISETPTDFWKDAKLEEYEDFTGRDLEDGEEVKDVSSR